MTPQEEQLLQSLVQRVNSTQLQEKDPDAENLLNRELGNNPDALYILAQTVLVQDIALGQARAQVTQLQQQVQQARQPAHTTSFLGSLLGHRDPEPAPPQQPVYAQPAPPPPYGQPQYQYQQPQYAPIPSGQPSFLRGAMQTAAGVAAGALAFEGVESVLHGLGGHGGGYGWGEPGFGMGPGMMGGGFERPIEETVVNNYYDEPGGGRGGEQHFRESGDRGGAQFTDASYDTSAGDDNMGDDQGSYDESSLDDSTSFDDGGSDNGSDFG